MPPNPANQVSFPPAPEGKKLPLARVPNLWEEIDRNFEAMGVAGEKRVMRGLYMVATSRLLNKPLGGLAQGESGSGKSAMIEATTQFMPPESVIRATRLTPQALYHLEEPPTHKFVAGGERSRMQDDWMAEQTAALRQLRSEGKIVKQITEKNGSDHITREKVVEGPISFVESTTLDKAIIFKEDLNRGLILKTNGSKDQNRLVMQKLAEPYSVDAVDVDRDAIIERHRDFQRLLLYVDVRIPYVRVLADKMPALQVQSRRVFEQVLAVIETQVLLHQHHRVKDKDGRMLATPDDYAVARDMLLESVRQAVGDALGLTDATWTAYCRLRKRFPKEFTGQDTLDAKIFNNPPTRNKQLDKLAGFGVLKCVQKSLGRVSSRWRWSTKMLGDLLLPSVKEIGATIKP
jgi:hypothetical protein